MSGGQCLTTFAVHRKTGPGMELGPSIQLLILKWVTSHGVLGIGGHTSAVPLVFTNSVGTIYVGVTMCIPPSFAALNGSPPRGEMVVNGNMSALQGMASTTTRGPVIQVERIGDLAVPPGVQATLDLSQARTSLPPSLLNELASQLLGSLRLTPLPASLGALLASQLNATLGPLCFNATSLVEGGGRVGLRELPPLLVIFKDEATMRVAPEAYLYLASLETVRSFLEARNVSAAPFPVLCLNAQPSASTKQLVIGYTWLQGQLVHWDLSFSLLSFKPSNCTTSLSSPSEEPPTGAAPAKERVVLETAAPDPKQAEGAADLPPVAALGLEGPPGPLELLPANGRALAAGAPGISRVEPPPFYNATKVSTEDPGAPKFQVLGGYYPVKALLGEADIPNGFFAEVFLGSPLPLRKLLRLDSTAPLSFLSGGLWREARIGKCADDFCPESALCSLDNRTQLACIIDSGWDNWCSNTSVTLLQGDTDASVAHLNALWEGAGKPCSFIDPNGAMGFKVFGLLRAARENGQMWMRSGLGEPFPIGIRPRQPSTAPPPAQPSSRQPVPIADGIMGLSASIDTYGVRIWDDATMISGDFSFTLCLEGGPKESVSRDGMMLMSRRSGFAKHAELRKYPVGPIGWTVVLESMWGISNLSSAIVALNSSAPRTVLPPDLFQRFMKKFTSAVPAESLASALAKRGQEGLYSSLEAWVGPACFDASGFTDSNGTSLDLSKFPNINLQLMKGNSTTAFLVQPSAYLHFVDSMTWARALAAANASLVAMGGGAAPPPSGANTASFPVMCVTAEPKGDDLFIQGGTQPPINKRARILLGYTWLRNKLLSFSYWSYELSWKDTDCASFKAGLSDAAVAAFAAAEPPPAGPAPGPAAAQPLPGKAQSQVFIFPVTGDQQLVGDPPSDALRVLLPVGKPLRKFTLRLDTASAGLPWIECSCDSCADKTQQYSAFNSSTFSSVACDDPKCSGDSSQMFLTCSPEGLKLPSNSPYCVYAALGGGYNFTTKSPSKATLRSLGPWAAFPSSQGNMVADFSQLQLLGGGDALDLPTVFGCGTFQTRAWRSPSLQGSQGVLDLSASKLSIPSQAYSFWNASSSSFGLCLDTRMGADPREVFIRPAAGAPGTASKAAAAGTGASVGSAGGPAPVGGVLLLGLARDAFPSAESSVPINPNAKAPFLAPTSIEFHGSQRSFLADQSQVLLDINSPISTFPPDAVDAVAKRLASQHSLEVKSNVLPPLLKGLKCFRPNSKGIRRSNGRQMNYSSFEPLDIIFSPNTTFSIPPEAYLFFVPKPPAPPPSPKTGDFSGFSSPPPPASPESNEALCLLLKKGTTESYYSIGWTWLRGKLVNVDYNSRTLSWTNAPSSCTDRSALASLIGNNATPSPEAEVPPPPKGTSMLAPRTAAFSFMAASITFLVTFGIL